MNNIIDEFKKFKENYNYEMSEIFEIDGIKYVDEMPLYTEDGKEIDECEKWINISYKSKEPRAKALSNLFPYTFEFRGKVLNSIESFFQGIKFKDIEMQDLVFKYSGINSNYVKVCTSYNWQETGLLYWQGQPIDRFSKNYDDLVDELYISAIQNPLYRNILKTCNKKLIHTMGKEQKNETTFTRYEFEKEINCLKDFIINN